MPPVTYPVNEIWPVVVWRICRLWRKWEGRLDWTPLDVFDSLRDQRAFLFCSDTDSSFCIVRLPRPDTLFVWIACGINGKREQNTALLREIAHNVGATRIEMESPRPGFNRMPGWQRLPGTTGMVKFRLEV